MAPKSSASKKASKKSEESAPKGSNPLFVARPKNLAIGGDIRVMSWIMTLYCAIHIIYV